MHEPALRAAAFGSGPLPGPAVARGSGRPRERLLAAVVLGAQGRYAAAATLLDSLRRGRDPVTASLAASTLASHRRQLGGHRRARALDGEAFAKVAHLATKPDPDGPEPEAATPRPRTAAGREPVASSAEAAATGRDPDGLDAPGALADALLGLAADNLALGRLTAARRLAERAAAADHGWRATVRRGWVGAEIELAAGQGAAAVPHARVAFETARARGARRHTVKSGIVLAVALSAAGDPDHRKISDELVGNAMATAEECELLSLSWPAALVAADLRPGHAEEYRFRVAQVLHAVLRSADPCGRRVAGESPWVPVPGG
ncbi:hypothetical protein [Amycolatopsis sp. Hca4]|uniref:hypothetical protein n=1 Tax=Amycolatopsis sp. Hca4 TaxID=2742131 RepID=UPI001592453E|nr:hypothetical protein [Amycolatopsis sp. Hca4]QKV76428.1 hypothetical protein HUT10_23565 [Amycolatopsis sp. Hca4]